MYTVAVTVFGYTQEVPRQLTYRGALRERLGGQRAHDRLGAHDGERDADQVDGRADEERVARGRRGRRLRPLARVAADAAGKTGISPRPKGGGERGGARAERERAAEERRRADGLHRDRVGKEEEHRRDDGESALGPPVQPAPRPKARRQSRQLRWYRGRHLWRRGERNWSSHTSGCRGRPKQQSRRSRTDRSAAQGERRLCEAGHRRRGGEETESEQRDSGRHQRVKTTAL